MRRPAWLGGLGGRAEAIEPPDPEAMAALSSRLDAAAQTRLGRSLAILPVSTGGCNGCELELRALDGVLYDLRRLGLRFVTNPRHADVLLATGPLTRNLVAALERAWDATPEPRWVVAVGDCAIDGGVFKGSYAVVGGIGLCVPVDLRIAGCPPPPAKILSGLQMLLEANAR